MPISLRSLLRGRGPAAGRFPAAAPVLGLMLVAAVAGRSVAAEAQPDWRLPERPMPRELSRAGVVVSVTPLLVEPVIAFYIGRGFPAQAARRYAASCVIRVVMRNASAPARISYDLRSWRTRVPGGVNGALSTREDWMKEWQAGALPDTARIGFEWSQLPTTQELDVGDSTQGMVNTGLPAGTRFDLLLEWVSAGKTNRNDLQGIHCAPSS